MKNHKQLLADFYLALLANAEYKRKSYYPSLCETILDVLVFELDSDKETIQRIFERMAREDASS